MSDPTFPQPPDDHSVKIPHLIFGLLFLGIAFFLQYAYDRDWLGHIFGPRLRIATATALAPSLAPSMGAFLRCLSASAKGRVSQCPKMAIRRAAVGWYCAIMLRPLIWVPSKVMA